VFSILYLSFSGKYRNIAMIGNRQIKQPFDTIYAMLFSILASPFVATIIVVLLALGLFAIVFSLALIVVGGLMLALIYIFSFGKPFEEKNDENIILEDLFEDYDGDYIPEIIDYEEEKTKKE